MTIAESIKDTANFGPNLTVMAKKYATGSTYVDKYTTRFDFADGSLLIASKKVPA